MSRGQRLPWRVIRQFSRIHTPGSYADEVWRDAIRKPPLSMRTLGWGQPDTTARGRRRGNRTLGAKRLANRLRLFPTKETR